MTGLGGVGGLLHSLAKWFGIPTAEPPRPSLAERLAILEEAEETTPALPIEDRSAASGPCACGRHGHVDTLRQIISAHYPDVIVGEPLVVVGEVIRHGERSVVVCSSFAAEQDKNRMVRLNKRLMAAFREVCGV